MRTSCAIASFILLGMTAAPAWAQDAPPTPPTPTPTPAPVEAPHATRGAIELRIQTSSNVAAGGLFGIETSPGIVWNPDSGNWNLNLSGGAGYFVSPMIAVGGDLSITLLHSTNTTSLITLAPYVKIVTNFPERRTGLFVEPSLGLTLVSLGGLAGEQTLFQLSAWGGGHFFVGQSAAILAGPFVTMLANFDGGSTSWLLGIRFGLSVYLL
jgi:hypothetical protein